VVGCPSCGAELPVGARFCAFCGARVETLGAVAQDRRPVAEERRTVTILFVDLVGFTERSDRADPEDVRRTLVPFHARVKEDIERFGGTLDKFIGDAAMGVFGAPVAHEDDPVRAVHAARAILGSIDDLRRHDPDLAVRIAVNTGEAVVSFGAGPQVGEAVAGDVVNTASRMQSLAPMNAIVIGPETLRAVHDRFEVEAMPPVPVKGKREPLEVWRVLAERVEARPGADGTPFVGRRHELETLVERFGRVERSGSAELVVIVAEAGVGKSRLVAELAASLGGRARTLLGGCLPYGEGVTFEPIGRTLRALAGVEVRDEPDTVHGALEALAARVEADPGERRWLAHTLGAVLGPDPSPEGTTVSADDIAQAWARVLGAAAGERPVLLAIEDLHDAAPAFADVLASTAVLLAAHPLLLVATARPGTALPGTLATASTLALGALDDSETGALLDAVLPEGAVSDASRRAALERAAGNPLYAIELARMLAESGDEAATPASVQAVIAARLDGVPVDARALALGAAVLGEEVWPEALARLEDRGLPQVLAGLAELERRGLIERRASSLPGEEAFGFAHSLIREVAYRRLPRAARARRHLAAARWLEERSGRRADGWAETLARHYAAAAELGELSREVQVVDEARAPALRWLTAAGDREARLDPAAAFTTFERALALAPGGSRERGEIVARLGMAGRRSGRLGADEVLAHYEEALAIARHRGDDLAIGEALTRVATHLPVTGQLERSRATLEEAVEVLMRHPPGRALARAYAHRAEEELFAGRTADAKAFADRALALLPEDLDEIAVMALHIRGDARCSMGDVDGGLDDLADALRRAEEGGRVGDVVTSRNYLGEWRWATGGPAAGLAEWERALELAERHNVRSQAMYTKAAAQWALLEAGRWDRVLAWSDELLSLPPGRLDPAVSVVARVTRDHVLLARGRRGDVGAPAELLSLAERTDEVAALAPALVAAAAIARTDGEVGRAVEHLERFGDATEGVAPEYRAVERVRAVRLCLACDRPDLAERLIGGPEPRVLRDRTRMDVALAMLAEARGEPVAAERYARLAERLRDYGDPYEEAMALLGLARTAGDRTAGARARVILEGLGAVVPA